MSREYTISEDKDYKKGNGIKAYIKDGKFICDVADECGNAGGEWFCDIDLLKQHIERYKAAEEAFPENDMSDFIDDIRAELDAEQAKERIDELEKMVADLVKTVNTLTAMMKPVVFVAEDEDKVAKIKKFLDENALDI